VVQTVAEHDAVDHVAERLRGLLREDLDVGFAELMREYQQVVYTIVLRVCERQADADDLAAEVFLRAYRALLRYSPARIDELRPRSWLLTIALNTGRNSARDRGRRPRQVTLEKMGERAPQGDAFDDVVARLDHRAALADLTACLPEKQREAVLLRHFWQLSSADVAEVLGCPEGTVRSHVSRGLGTLRRLAVERYPALATAKDAGATAIHITRPRREDT
jgi:RNA polymerase sigma factor (sigma-70 family)